MVYENFKNIDPYEFQDKELTLHDCIADQISMKKILLLLVVVCFFLTGCVNLKDISQDIDNYASDCESICNASVLMPDIADLGPYTDLKYTYQVTCYSVFMDFYSDGLALFVKYDPETYKIQKEQALSSYTFLEAPVMRDSDTYILPLTEFEYRDYLMKIIPDDDYMDYSACKSFMMLGLNDDDCVIVYLYYHDFDIDYIATIGDDLHAEMIDLVDSAFLWNAF